MNPDIMPPHMRILMWVVSLAVFALIFLTGYIAVQVADVEKEVQQLRSTSYDK